MPGLMGVGRIGQLGQPAGKPALGPNLISNGTFNTTADWTTVFGGNISDGVLKCQSTGGFARGVQAITTQSGQTYRIRYDVPLLNNNGIVRVGTTSTGFDVLSENVTATGSDFTHDFVSTATTLYVGLWLGSNTSGHRLDYDNVSVRRVF